MIHPTFVWMSYGWYSQGWWREIKNGSDFVSNTDNCTIEEMEEAIDRSLSFHHFPLPTAEENNSTTDVNYVCDLYLFETKCESLFYQTPAEFWEEFENILAQLDYPEEEAITQARYVYDAVWMIALTLNRSIDIIKDRLPGQSLSSFTYNNTAMTKIFIDVMSNITFRGVSVSKILCVCLFFYKCLYFYV